MLELAKLPASPEEVKGTIGVGSNLQFDNVAYSRYKTWFKEDFTNSVS